MPIYLNAEKLSVDRIVKGISWRFQNMSRRLLVTAGIDLYQRTHDRYILEQVIFPFFAKDSRCRHILFIGCEWYTKGYQKIFVNKQYATLEIDPAKKKFGSSQRHIIDTAANLAAYFTEASLDLVICNGVFGWGLNDRQEIEKTFRACHACLRKGGVFVLGWNDRPEHKPVQLEELASLRLFQQFIFPPLKTGRFLTENQRHVYDFYIKEDS